MRLIAGHKVDLGGLSEVLGKQKNSNFYGDIPAPHLKFLNLFLTSTTMANPVGNRVVLVTCTCRSGYVHATMNVHVCVCVCRFLCNFIELFSD